MKVKNIEEYCVFHITSLEILNDVKILPLFKKKAEDLFYPSFIKKYSPKNSIIKEISNPTHNKSRTLYRNAFNHKRSVAKSFMDIYKAPSRLEVSLNATVKGSALLTDDTAIQLIADIDRLKKVIKVKKHHLALLRKQMAEQTTDSCVSDADDFYTVEEKASTQELKELEAELQRKEMLYNKVVDNFNNIEDNTSQFDKKVFTKQEIPQKKVESENISSDHIEQQLINTAVRSFCLRLLKKATDIYGEGRVWESIIQKGNQANLLNDSKQFYLWISSSFDLLNKKLCFKSYFILIHSKEIEQLQTTIEKFRRNEEALKEQIAELKSRVPEIDEAYFKKTRSCSLNNGTKATSKILKTLENERLKYKMDKYKSEIAFLMKENEELKKAIEDSTTVKEDYVKTVVNRAVKLHNYIAKKFNINPIEVTVSNQRRQWEIIDTFTKQARMYIRITEKNDYNMNKLVDKERLADCIENNINEQALDIGKRRNSKKV